MSIRFLFVFLFTPNIWLRDLAHVRRYDGAQGTDAYALQYSAHGQHPNRLGDGETHPAQYDEYLVQNHAVTGANYARNGAGG